MKKVNQKDRQWEPGSHEDPQNLGVWKKVIVKHSEVDPKSKLMMINLAKVPLGKTHIVHSHETMEEIFYFLEGEGKIKVNNEVTKIKAGDRIIVPAKAVHKISNTGKTELKFIGLGIALD